MATTTAAVSPRISKRTLRISTSSSTGHHHQYYSSSSTSSSSLMIPPTNHSRVSASQSTATASRRTAPKVASLFLLISSVVLLLVMCKKSSISSSFSINEPTIWSTTSRQASTIDDKTLGELSINAPERQLREMNNNGTVTTMRGGSSAKEVDRESSINPPECLRRIVASNFQPSTATRGGTIFLHMGPPKTGSTSLQNFFTNNTDFLLRQMNTIYLGKVNPRDFPRKLLRKGLLPHDYVRPVRQYNQGHAMETLKDYLQKMVVENQHNVILSDEDFGSQNLTRLLQLFPKNDTTTIVPIVVYRPYHEWIRSMYQFDYGPKWYEASQWSDWPASSDDSTTAAAAGPSNTIPTFAEYIQTFLQETPPVLQTIRKFQDAFLEEQQSKGEGAKNDVYTTNSMKEHEPTPSTARPACFQILQTDHPSGESLTDQFISLINEQGQPLSKAKTTKHPSRPVPEAHDRSNVNTRLPFAVDAERMALYLYQRGIIGTPEERNPLFRKGARLTRRKWVDKIQQHMINLYYYHSSSAISGDEIANGGAHHHPHPHDDHDIPWECPSLADIERLWTQTIFLHEWMVSNQDSSSFTATLRNDALKNRFDNAVRNRHFFCNLDVDRLWNDMAATGDVKTPSATTTTNAWRTFVNDTFAELEFLRTNSSMVVIRQQQ